eukprot:Gb_04977 [translate_table: standard]
MEGSDNGSGTQSSWTKRDVEVQSVAQSGKCELGWPHSSTSQNILLKKEKKKNEWLQLVGTSGECGDEKAFDNGMGQDLEIAVPRQAATYVKHLPEEKILHDQASAKKEDIPSAICGEGGQINKGSIDTGSNGSGEPFTKAIDLIGAMSSKAKDRYVDQEDNVCGEEVQGKGATLSEFNGRVVSDFNSKPLLELTLKRSRPSGDEESEPGDKRVLRQSDASAFSRYNTSATHISYPWGGTFSPHIYSLPKEYGDHTCMPSENTGSLHLAVPNERMGSSKGSVGDVLSHHQLSQSANNQDMGSSVIGPSGQETFPSAVLIKDVTVSTLPVPPRLVLPMSIPPGVMPFDGMPPAYGAALHPLFYSHTGVSVWGSATPLKEERGGTYDNSAHREPHLVIPQALHHSHHYNHHHHHHIQHHHHHHHHHQAHKHKQHPKQDEQTVNNAATTAPRCGSSNIVGNTSDGNYGQSGSSNDYGSNANVNGSVSGSNNNGNNGHNAGVTPGTNGESGTGNGVTSGTRNAVDQNLFTRREAALTKFRQKRKERCFEKKVRYQSRKRLADQRPRVRGQFVRQARYESATGEVE